LLNAYALSRLEGEELFGESSRNVNTELIRLSSGYKKLCLHLNQEEMFSLTTPEEHFKKYHKAAYEYLLWFSDRNPTRPSLKEMSETLSKEETNLLSLLKDLVIK
jgi:hypothetical protein